MALNKSSAKQSWGRILGDFAKKGTKRGWTPRSKVEKFADLPLADRAPKKFADLRFAPLKKLRIYDLQTSTCKEIAVFAM